MKSETSSSNDPVSDYSVLSDRPLLVSLLHQKIMAEQQTPADCSALLHIKEIDTCQVPNTSASEDQKDHIVEQLTYLQEHAWVLFEKYENIMRLMHSKAATHMQLISEAFQDISRLLQTEANVQLKALEGLENKTLNFTSLMSSMKEMQEKIRDKKLKWRERCDIAVKTSVMNAQLEEMLTMKRVIDGAISPLQTHEWRGIRHFMKPIPDPLCFDPESANPNLRVSIDLTQVKFQPSTENLKDRRHCFEPGLYVLAMPGFQSGLHYWEVDVGLKSNWIIGVVKGLVERKGITELSPPHGYFVLRKHKDYEFYGLGSLPLMVKTSPIRIGVSLDLIRHHLAFYDADTAKMIYEYSDCSLDKGLFAFFCPGVPIRVEDWRSMKLCL